MSQDLVLPVERRALRDGVYDRILEMLLSGTLAPGANLSIDGIARDLHVSPTPVREAFSHLEHTGLVSRTALRGYRVAPPLTRTQMAQLVDAREIIEVGAIERAWPDLDELIVDLRVAHEHHAKVLSDAQRGGHRSTSRLGAYRDHFNADWDFHLTIMRHTHNSFIVQMAENMGSHVHRLRQSFSQGDSDAEDALREHAAILAAVDSRSLEAAKTAMMVHLQGVRVRSTQGPTE